MKATSISNSSLAKAFLAPRRINSQAGAGRLINYCQAGSVASGARMLAWAHCWLFHLRSFTAASRSAATAQALQWKSGPDSV